MDPEPEEVDAGRDEDEADDAREEVASDVVLQGGRTESAVRLERGKRGAGGREGETHHRVAAADVEDVPQVDDDGGPDGEERKEADHFARDGEREEDAREDEPGPPRARELAADGEGAESAAAVGESETEPKEGRGARTSSAACGSGCTSRRRGT